MSLEDEKEVGFWNQVSTMELDGAEECYNAKGFCLKGFWVAILIACTVPLYIYNQQIFSSFTAKTSVTSIDEIRADQLMFPNVTLCARNRFNRTFIKDVIKKPYGWQQWNMDEDSIEDNFSTYILSLVYQSVQLDNKVNSYMAKIYDYNFNKSVNIHAVDIKKWLISAALQCESMLYRCLFLLKDFSCCENASPVISDYGVCWQLKKFSPTSIKVYQCQSTSINAQHIYVLTHEGTFFGARRQMKQLIAQIIQARDNRSSDAFQTMAGTNMGAVVASSIASSLRYEDEFDFRLHIGNSLNPIDVDINSVIIPPRQQAVVRMDPTKYVIDPNTEPCLENAIQLAYHREYNQGLCQNECLLNVTLKVCGCGALGYGASISSDKVCSPDQMQKCFLPLLLQQRQNKNKEVADCMSSKCLQMCQYMSYQPYVTYTGMKSLVDDQSWYLQLAIYFGDIKYTSIQSQLLTDINGLVMGIGGVCGLWTGMSVITVIQLCANIVFYPLYRKAEKEKYEKEKKGKNVAEVNTKEKEKGVEISSF